MELRREWRVIGGGSVVGVFGCGSEKRGAAEAAEEEGWLVGEMGRSL